MISRQLWRVPRRSVYAGAKQAAALMPTAARRGTKTALRDAEPARQIYTVLQRKSFLGEGQKKVTARMRKMGIRIRSSQVLRLMQDNRLLAPVRRCHGLRQVLHQCCLWCREPIMLLPP